MVVEFLYYMLDRKEIREGKMDVPPGNGGNGGGAWTPGFWPSMGFDADCPSAAYEFVMESMTDWAFSWPISGTAC